MSSVPFLKTQLSAEAMNVGQGTKDLSAGSGGMDVAACVLLRLGLARFLEEEEEADVCFMSRSCSRTRAGMAAVAACEAARLERRVPAVVVLGPPESWSVTL